MPTPTSSSPALRTRPRSAARFLLPARGAALALLAAALTAGCASTNDRVATSTEASSLNATNPDGSPAGNVRSAGTSGTSKPAPQTPTTTAPTPAPTSTTTAPTTISSPTPSVVVSPSSAPTTASTTPTVIDPETAAKKFVDAWQAGDSATAATYGSADAVAEIFGHAMAAVTFDHCEGAMGSTYCTFAKPGLTLVIRVNNGTGGGPVQASSATFS